MMLHETHSTKTTQNRSNEIFSPLADYQNITGNPVPNARISMSSLPAPIRYFGYFAFSVIGVGTIVTLALMAHSYWQTFTK